MKYLLGLTLCLLFILSSSSRCEKLKDYMLHIKTIDLMSADSCVNLLASISLADQLLKGADSVVFNFYYLNKQADAKNSGLITLYGSDLLNFEDSFPDNKVENYLKKHEKVYNTTMLYPYHLLNFEDSFPDSKVGYLILKDDQRYQYIQLKFKFLEAKNLYIQPVFMKHDKKLAYELFSIPSELPTCLVEQ